MGILEVLFDLNYQELLSDKQVADIVKKLCLINFKNNKDTRVLVKGKNKK